MAENIALTVTELFELTHYVRALEQLRELQRMGIRAHRRADGTVCVLRAWLAEPGQMGAQSGPKLRPVRGLNNGAPA